LFIRKIYHTIESLWYEKWFLFPDWSCSGTNQLY
jgi:hypothetical protein